MLKRLRRNLSIIFFLSTTSIVVVVLAAALVVMERQADTTYNQQFQNTVNTIVAKLQRGNAISNTWLAEVEMQSAVILYLEDNGMPFLFRGITPTATGREELLEQAQSLADRNMQPLDAFPEVMQCQFTVDGRMGDRYRASFLIIPSENGTLNAIVMQDEGSHQEKRTAQRRTFLLLGMGATLAFFVISRLLARKAVEPTERSIKQQTDFVAAASHEIRSPLAVIRAGLQSADGPVEEQTLEIIRRETERLGRLTNDLLFLATSDSQSWGIEKKDFSPDTLCLNLFEAYRPVAEQRERKLTLEMPDNILPDVYADENRIEQVLIILINNALSHTPAGTEIKLSAQSRGKAVIFTVMDNGEGIASEDRERIFERFYKADKSRSDKQRAGLGLSIAKEIVRKHGGRIWAEDTPGGGSTFHVSIPILQNTK